MRIMNVLFGIDRKMFHRVFDPADVARGTGKLAWIPPNPSADLPETISLNWIEDRITEAEVLITGWGTPALTEDLLDRAKKLRLVLHSAGSVKHLLTPTFFQRGLTIGNARAALARGVAETALGMIIASAKMFPPMMEATRKGAWHGSGEYHDWVLELYNVTIGVVGLSEVGKNLLRLLRPFEDTQRILYDPYATPEAVASHGAKKVELADLCRRSDIIVLCAPATPQTHHMIGAEQFRLMKPRVRLVNPARGSLVDEAVLIEYLRAGKLTAFLDVTDPEPPAADNPLRSLPNCFLTPHIAGAVNNGVKRQGRLVVDELLKYLSEGTIQWKVRAEDLSRMG